MSTPPLEEFTEHLIQHRWNSTMDWKPFRGVYELSRDERLELLASFRAADTARPPVPPTEFRLVEITTKVIA
jgi:hypothetical protein